MVIMKRFMALLTASLLVTSMTVSAAESPSTSVVVKTETKVIVVQAPPEAVEASCTQPSYAGEGFANASDAQAAAQRGLSAGEYYNNAVSSAPGVTNAMPVGQDGRILINGVPSNLTATLSRVSSAVASSAQSQAALLGGRLLNVVGVKFPAANFNAATVNFYVKGLPDGTRIAARQYVNGQWIEVDVAESRTDHVILILKENGPVAFIALP
jgi:hypothetical protein